jgi:hypothetical protein
MSDPEIEKVFVLVDSKDPKSGERRRPSHWREALCSFSSITLTEWSIAEEIKSNSVLNLEEPDLLIINWDCINGDAAYEADIPLQFFQSHGKVRLKELMQNGGVLLCEFQTIKGVPVQASYDALFGNSEIKVLRDVLDDDERCGNKAEPFKRYYDHPLLPAVPEFTASPEKPERLFRASYTGNEELERPMYEKYQDSLWFGWFTYWGKDWIPLIAAQKSEKQKHKYPTFPSVVLLAKYTDNGLMIASTMSIARARCKKLIEKLLTIQMEDVRKYHNHIRIFRRINDISSAFFLFMILVFLTYLFFELYNRTDLDKNFSFDFYARLILSITSIGILGIATSLANFYKKYICSRPLGISVLQSIIYSIRRK